MQVIARQISGLRLLLALNADRFYVAGALAGSLLAAAWLLSTLG